MYQRPKKHIEQDLVWSMVQFVGKLITLPFRGIKSNTNLNKHHQISTADLEKIRSKWVEVHQLMQQNGPSHFRLAIMHADTALDGALQALDLPGRTMGDRLKVAGNHFTPETYNMIWQAHKVRNRLAHEMDSEVMSWEAREAVASFELALREIGVLNDGFDRKA